MNPMLKRLFQIQFDEILRKAVYVADEMRDHFGICFVCRLEEKGFSFRFMKDPEKYIDIDIYPEDETVGMSGAKVLYRIAEEISKENNNNG